MTEERGIAIEAKLEKLLTYFQDEPSTPGIFSRIRKNEEFRGLSAKINWVLLVSMMGIIVKSFIV